MSRYRVAIVLVAMLLLVASPAAVQASPAPVYPPTASPRGMTYGEWSALWWKQVFAIPADTNPLLQDGEVPCALGSGKVVFLVGTFGGQVERSCSVPAGTSLLLPLVNAECSTVEGDGQTEAELRQCAAAIADEIDSVNASVNGEPIDGLKERFRFVSPLFTFTLPEGNILSLPAGSSPAVADGYWVMLTPLPPGTHTISFGGTASAFSFSTQATYEITVG